MSPQRSLLRSALLALLTSVLTLALALGGALVGPSSAAVPGHITGVVLDPDGEALADVEVNLFAWDDDDEYWDNVDWTETDGDGAYDLGGLAAGTYRVGFRDYYSGHGYLAEYWDGASSVDDADDITVAAGQTVPDIDARLTDSGHISGTVTGPAGQAAGSVTVVAYRYEADDDYWDWNTSTMTGVDGSYDVGGLATGTYRLQFTDSSGNGYISEYWNDAATLSSATSISVTAGQTAAGRNAQLAAGGRITGTVTAPDGQPASSISVTAYRQADGGYWQSVGWSFTGNGGTYSLDGLATGTYRIGFYDSSGHGYAAEYWNDAWTVEAASDISVTAGQTIGSRNAQLALGSTIGGTVTGPDGQPVADVEVDLYRYDSGLGYWRNAGYAETDGSGAYTVTSLSAGTYRIHFTDYSSHHYVSEYWDDASSLATATDVTVGAGQVVTGRNAQLAASSQVTGTVTAPEGGPADGISVTAYRYDSEEEYWESVAWTETDGTGSYALNGLAPGTYRVGFIDYSGTGYLSEYWNNATTIQTATDIAVTAGQTVTGKDAQLAAGGHITGTVLGPDGEPAADIGVDAYRYDQSNDDWRYVADVETADNGTYDVGRLPTGTYRISFSDYSGSGYITEYWNNATSLETATDIAVTAGQTVTGKNAQLAAGGRITGTVLAPNGGPATDVDVAAYRQVGGDWEDVAYTGTTSNGSYDLDGLPTGTYRIQFWDYSNMSVTEYWDDATSLGAATDIAVTAGQTVAGKNAQLAAGGRITGTVTGANGQTLSEVAVTAYRLVDDSWIAAGWGMTGPGGTYDVGRLPTGTYRLWFDDSAGRGYLDEYWNDARSLETAADIAVTAGQTVTGRNAQLTLGSAPAITNSARPVISGVPQVGSTLTATGGSWSPSDELSLSYQWIVGGVPVTGAGGATYTPAVGDVGKAVEVEVTAGRSGYTSATVRSDPTAAVADVPAPPTGTPAPTPAAPTTPTAPATVAITAIRKPTLKGTVKKNATLTVTTGTWSPSQAKVAVQWYAGGKAIKKATATKLKIAAKTAKTVVGKTVTVTLTVTAPGYPTTTTTLTAKGKLAKPKKR